MPWLCTVFNFALLKLPPFTLHTRLVLYNLIMSLCTTWLAGVATQVWARRVIRHRSLSDDYQDMMVYLRIAGLWGDSGSGKIVILRRRSGLRLSSGAILACVLKATALLRRGQAVLCWYTPMYCQVCTAVATGITDLRRNWAVPVSTIWLLVPPSQFSTAHAHKRTHTDTHNYPVFLLCATAQKLFGSFTIGLK